MAGTVTRFAPSPTGLMHAGNIFAALAAWLEAKSQGGRVVLRIEDLDRDRSKAEFIDRIPRDFERLGLFWDEGPYFQHDRDEVYARCYGQLESRGLTYPCFCTRADLLSASAPHRGEKTVYSGRCRSLSSIEAEKARESRLPAFRLLVPHRTIAFEDGFQGEYSQELETECGDFVVKRSDGAFAYQLAVVVDDGDEGVNLVVRGVDLLCSTPQQIYLQELLGYTHPRYCHVPLLVARSGVRLSKRNRDAALDDMLGVLKTPEAVIGYIACVTGIIDEFMPCTPEELLGVYSTDRLRGLWEGRIEIPWIAPGEADFRALGLRA